MINYHGATIGSYMDNSSKNYGLNSLYITIGKLEIYFSYKTVIAFRDNGLLTISENYWGPTTGKHLNKISPDKTKRVKFEVFEKTLNDTLEKYGLIGVI